MPRTTAEAVIGIIELDDEADDLTPFIASAAILVDRAAALDEPPSAVELEIVERWLAAHYYAVYRQRPASERAGPVSESKQYWVGSGLQTTMYGTQAMTLDSSGILAAANCNVRCSGSSTGGPSTKRKVGAYWLGKKY